MHNFRLSAATLLAAALLAPAQAQLRSSTTLQLADTRPLDTKLVQAADKPGPAPAAAPPAAAPLAGEPPRYGLEELIALAEREHPGLQAVRAQSLAARAGVTSAGAYPNPEVEYVGSDYRARQAGAATGAGSSITFTQRIENPALRSARVDVANAGVQGAQINLADAQNELVARIKTEFFAVLRREEEVGAATEDLALTEQIRERVRVRTSTGEGARFDLLRSDAEVAIAVKEKERAEARLAQARALLQAAVAARLPAGFTLAGDFYRRLPGADYNGLRGAVLAGNPSLRRALADTSRAEKQLEVERQSVMPAIALQLGHERQPDTTAMRAGVAIAIPLWDRRRGQIDAARAQIMRSRSEAELRSIELAQGFDAAWQQYQAAFKTVQAFEGGILEQSRKVVEIAEAAYRYGERGILEYLDARRQYRVARNDLIAARFELHAAKAELERLAASDFRETRMEK